MFHVFVLVCFSCVVCFHLKELICIILFLCYFCHKTKLSSCLHRVVLLPFFCLCCFVLNFVSSFLPPKKPDTAKTPKSKNAEKTDK